MAKTAIDSILTKAQLAAAKADLKAAVQREIGNVIRVEAKRIARKFVKDNKYEITKELRKRFAKELKNDYDRIVKEAVKEANIILATRW
jgi:hypothetical protein